MASENENLERLKKLLNDEKYDEAIMLAGEIKEKQAKSASDVLALARVYGKMHDFKRSENLFKKAYRLRPSKLMYHDVMDMCLENGHVKDAEEYLEEYCALSNYDKESALNYEYKIKLAKNADKDDLIDVLKRLLEISYTENMAYELAKLYYRSGKIEECLEECEKIIKYFYLSPIVKRASLLMAYCKGDVTAEEIKSFADENESERGTADEKACAAAYDTADEKAYADVYAAEESHSPEFYADTIMESEKINDIKDSAEAVYDIMDEEEQAAMNELVHNIATKCMKNSTKPKKEKKSFFGKGLFGNREKEKEYASYANFVMPDETEDREDEISEDAETESHDEPQDESAREPQDEFMGESRDDFQGESQDDFSDADGSNLTYGSSDDDIYEELMREAAQSIANDISDGEEAENAVDTAYDSIAASDRSETYESENAYNNKNAYNTGSANDNAGTYDPEDTAPNDSLKFYVPYTEQFTFEYRNEKLCGIMKRNNVDVYEICKNYYRIPETRKLIFQALDMAINYRGTMCLVVTGEKESGKSTLALRLVKLYCKIGILKSGKVAKIGAEKLNKIDFESQKKALYECNILIENAGDIEPKVLNQIIDYYDNKHNGTGIILEDETKDINKLFREDDEYVKRFNSRIHLPKYKTEDLMGFMYDIFSENDYRLDKDAAVMLAEVLDNRPRNAHALTWTAGVANIVIENADNRLSPAILEMAKKGEYENSKLVITKEDIV